MVQRVLVGRVALMPPLVCVLLFGSSCVPNVKTTLLRTTSGPSRFSRLFISSHLFSHARKPATISLRSAWLMLPRELDLHGSRQKTGHNIAHLPAVVLRQSCQNAPAHVCVACVCVWGIAHISFYEGVSPSPPVPWRWGLRGPPIIPDRVENMVLAFPFEVILQQSTLPFGAHSVRLHRSLMYPTASLRGLRSCAAMPRARSRPTPLLRACATQAAAAAPMRLAPSTSRGTSGGVLARTIAGPRSADGRLAIF